MAYFEVEVGEGCCFQRALEQTLRYPDGSREIRRWYSESIADGASVMLVSQRDVQVALTVQNHLNPCL